MRTKIKSLALMAAIMVMAQPMPYIRTERIVKKDTSYLRKKCKSCKLLLGTYCQVKSYRRQQDVVCEEYKHR